MDSSKSPLAPLGKQRPQAHLPAVPILTHSLIRTGGCTLHLALLNLWLNLKHGISLPLQSLVFCALTECQATAPGREK